MKMFTDKSIRSLLLAFVVFLVGSTTAVAQVDVTAPDTSGKEGANIQIPITVSDLSGQGVTSYDFTMEYDTSVVKVNDVITSGTLTEGAQTSKNIADSGSVSVAAASGSEFSGSGTLVILDAQVVSDQGTSNLDFINFQFNEGSPSANVTDGSIFGRGPKVYISDNITGFSGDTVTVPVQVEDLTGEGVSSYEFTLNYDSNILSAESVDASGTISEGLNIQFNSSSGEVSVAAASGSNLSGGGTLINLKMVLANNGTSNLSFGSFQFNEGDPSPFLVDGMVTVADITVHAPNVKTADRNKAVGDTDMLPITASQLTGKGASSYEFTLHYNSSVVNITGVETSGTVSSNMNINTNTSNQGEISVAAASSSDLTGANGDTLLYVVVEYLSPGTSTLDFNNSFVFNEGDPLAATTTGSIMVSDNAPPVVDDIMVTTNEDAATNISLVATDPDGNQLSFSIVGGSGPSNGSLGSLSSTSDTSASVQYTPQENYNGSDYFAYRVSDGTLTSMDTVHITVNAVNDVPVAESFSYTVMEDSEGTFGLQGSDVEGDQLTFEIVEGPSNGSLSNVTSESSDSASFTYTPNANFDGNDSFTYLVFDGQDSSDVATVNINVMNVKDRYTIAEAKELPEGTEATITGVMTTPDLGASSGRFFLQDTSGGVFVTYSSVGGNNNDTPFQQGDEVEITGLVGKTNKMIKINATDHVINSSGNSLPAAKQVADKDVATAFDYAGHLVTVNGLEVLEDHRWPSAGIGQSANVDVAASTVTGDTTLIRIDKGQSYYEGTELSNLPNQPWKITAVMGRKGDHTFILPIAQGDIMTGTNIDNNPSEGVPEQFKLVGNFPNPFNPTTTIKFNVPEAQKVSIEVYNMLGRKVATLVNEKMSAGAHTVTFEAGNLTSGVYLYRMQAGTYSKVKKMMLMK